MKRLHLVAAALAVAAVCGFAVLAPIASANGGGNGGGNGDHGKDKDKGKNGFPFDKIPGVLDAEGDGIQAAAGALNMELCAEEGLLLVKKGNSTISEVTSTESVEWLGLIVYFGFTGCVEISGEKAAALVVGTGLTLHAEGFGIAFLKGTGSYTSDGETHEGSTEGVVVKIGSKLFAKPTKTPKPSETDVPEPTSTPEPEPTATPT